MFQRLIDALNRLGNAADGDKPKHAQYAAAAIAGALAGGATGNYPAHDWDDVWSMTPTQLNAWKAASMTAAQEGTWPEEN